LDSSASRLAACWWSRERALGVFEHALHQGHEFVFLERLLDEIHRALLHAVDRHRHVAVAGDDHDRQRGFAFDQPVLQFEAGHAGHADVDDQAGDFALVVAAQRKDSAESKQRTL
jgi:hypothetical protein